MSTQPTWWQRNVGAGVNVETFKAWIEDHSAKSKVFCRKLVAARGHRSILDCGAGLCSEYDGYRADAYKIDYQALDATERFVEMAKEQGIPITLASVESIPFESGSFDATYCRHVLEHLPDYRKALAELVRVAKDETIIVWFIPPHEGCAHDDIEAMDGDLYHNSYNRADLGEYVRSLPGVARMEWMRVDEHETVLCITK